MEYEFTTDWLTRFTGVWDQLLGRYKPSKVLEIGCYEGRATTFLIDRCAAVRPFEIVCIDTWEGGVEHDAAGLAQVERRFDANVRLAAERAAHEVKIEKRKTTSLRGLSDLLASGRMGAFDMAYVDGSHQAPDVLADAVMAFHLVRVGGLIVFDDYLWSLERAGSQDAYNMPKPAIDAFVNIFQRKVSILGAPLYQLYMEKIAS